ncbi:MAG: hypothetical protein WAW61_02000 [Methylococcaceae bacterium]
MPFMRRNTAIAYCALWIAPYRDRNQAPEKAPRTKPEPQEVPFWPLA